MARMGDQEIFERTPSGAIPIDHANFQILVWFTEDGTSMEAR